MTHYLLGGEYAYKVRGVRTPFSLALRPLTWRSRTVVSGVSENWAVIPFQYLTLCFSSKQRWLTSALQWCKEPEVPSWSLALHHNSTVSFSVSVTVSLCVKVKSGWGKIIAKDLSRYDILRTHETWGVTCIFLDLITQVLYFLSPFYLYWLVCKWPKTQASWKLQILHWFLKGEDSKLLEPEQKTMVFQKPQRLREQRCMLSNQTDKTWKKETNFKKKNETFIFSRMVAKYLTKAFSNNKHTDRKLRHFKNTF